MLTAQAGICFAVWVVYGCALAWRRKTDTLSTAASVVLMLGSGAVLGAALVFLAPYLGHDGLPLWGVAVMFAAGLLFTHAQVRASSAIIRNAMERVTTAPAKPSEGESHTPGTDSDEKASL